MKSTRFLSSLFLLFAGVWSIAQDCTCSLCSRSTEVLQDLNFDIAEPNYEAAYAFNKTNITNRKQHAYPNLREADVAWSRKYERIIDARQKKNLGLLYPKSALAKILLKAAYTGMVDVYSKRDLTEPVPSERIPMLGVFKELISVPDSIDPSITHSYISLVRPNWESMVKFRIIEEWVFDKLHSKLIPRIVAIAPLYRPVVGGIELPEQPLFWIKYDEIRPIFANSEVFSRSNDAARLSYDHFFQARMFDSYVVKEPNVFDKDVAHYAEFEENTLAALLESERIKNEIFIMEHDLWEY